MPGDEELVQQAREGIQQLNQKYEASRRDPFYLFHRPRRWNATEGRWMGFERKRGKLLEFNAFLRGDDDRFAPTVGDATVRYPRLRAASSPWTPTRSCRATRPGRWLEQWPTRSIGR